jgi:hypothetical protein
MASEVPQIIYVLSNEAMPGLVKIGRTCGLEARMGALNNNTAVPMPFVCTYAATVHDAIYVERQIHTIFAAFRISGRREFFRVNPASVIAAIELVEVENITPGEQLPSASAEPTRGAFSREAAEYDIVSMLSEENSIPGPTALVQRWGVGKSCVSKWLDLFCEKGLIERMPVGRHVMLVRAGSTVSKLGQNETGPQSVSRAGEVFPECSMQRDGDHLPDTLSASDA